MRKSDIITITCPSCGRQYLPAEIYIPNEFFGKPNNISRYVDGSIDTFFGKSLDLNEWYVCDSCNQKFNVSAKIRFETSLEDTFEPLYRTSLKKPKITLLEE